jgi:hypothetical protein
LLSQPSFTRSALALRGSFLTPNVLISKHDKYSRIEGYQA